MVRKRLILPLLVVLCVPLGGAVTNYDIAVAEGAAVINVSFELTCNPDAPGSNCPVNYWQTSWGVPEKATVLAVQDSLGSIEDYDHVGDQLRFETNHGRARSKEVVTIVYRVPEVVDEEYNQVDLVRLQLSGFADEVTQAQVETGKELLAESHSFGYQYSLSEHSANYTGEGPLNLHLSLGRDDGRYDNFVLFGEGNISEADALYWTVSGITGFTTVTNKYPVIVLPDDVYDREIDPWSAGQYRTGGLIFIRQSTFDKDTGTAVILHEVVHAYNEHALRWTTATRAWFDEGVARYLESVINMKKEIEQPEIFGERLTWRCGRRKQCYYEPRGTPDQLWNYYEEDSSFMETWTPLNARSAEERTFGYAFSELLVRRYVLDHGWNALHPVYSELRQIDGKVTDLEATTNRILGIMAADFRPCYNPVRSRFESCLDEVNRIDPAIPDPVGAEQQRVSIQPIERPTYGQQSTGERIIIENIEDGAQKGGEAASSLLTRLLPLVRQLLDEFQALVSSYLG